MAMTAAMERMVMAAVMAAVIKAISAEATATLSEHSLAGRRVLLAISAGR